MLKRTFVVFLFLLVIGCSKKQSEAPFHVYLLLENEISNRVSIVFHSREKYEAPTVFYNDSESVGGRSNMLKSDYCVSEKFKAADGVRWVHQVSLDSLKPGKSYYFRAGDKEGKLSEWIDFKLPDPKAKRIRFVVGGDFGSSSDKRKLMEHAAKLEPDFAVLGGDYAYVEADLNMYNHWDAWLNSWQKIMVTPSGNLIPFIAAIGNHEVDSEISKIPDKAPYYFSFLPQNDLKSYFVRTLSNRIAFYILDSGCIYSHKTQKEWLAKQLESKKNRKFKFAIYHVPLFNTFREENDLETKNGRLEWQGLFENYSIDAAFEHNDHTFKRTFRMKGEEKDENGILYLGDGGWGMPPRPLREPVPDYLKKAATLQHFWLVEIEGDNVTYRAVGLDGRVFDVYPEDHPEAEEAQRVFKEITSQHITPVVGAN